MKHIIKKISILVFISILFISSFQDVAAVADYRIIEHQNQYGPYYGMEYTQNTVVNQEELKYTSATLRSPNKFNLEVAEEENQEEFQYIEAISETATLYQSEEDENVKRIELSNEVVNYFDGEAYYPIDTKIQGIMTLSMDASSYPYQNSTNTIQSYYPLQIAEGVVFIRNDTSVNLKPLLEGDLEPEVYESQIIYPMVDDIQIRYHVQKGRIKEDIIINVPTERTSFDYALEVNNGTAELVDNKLLILDESGAILFGINAPYVIDANQETAPIQMEYQDGIISYHVDPEWMNSPERAYPIIVDPQIFVFAHQGMDVSVAYNYPTYTIGDPDLASSGWILHDHDDAYLYLGNDPSMGDSYSFYKVIDESILTTLSGKYIKYAGLSLGLKEANKNNEVYACTINQNYDIKHASYITMPTDYTCLASTPVTTSTNTWVSLNVTGYIKNMVEKGAANNGILLALEDSSGYARFYAHEYYYIDEDHTYLPGMWIDYYDTPDVGNDFNLNDFTYQVRPFVKYDYTEGLAHFVAFGVDGVSSLDSTIKMTIKDNGTVVKTASTVTIDNFFHYPNYPVIEETQVYSTLESNYQFGEFYDGFTTNKVYTIDFVSSKGSQTSSVKSTWFQIAEIKGFDMLSNVARFYGVSIETLLEDNNLQDELVTEGNLLFIREPIKNQGVGYESEDLSDELKKQIDAALRGRGLECEFGFEPINLNTGNFLLEAIDFSVKVGSEKVSFERTYNSTAANLLGAFGYGWSHSANYYLFRNQSGVTIIFPDGKQYYFEEDGGSYSNLVTDQFKLEKDGEEFVLTHQEYSIRFNQNGTIQSYHNKKNEVTSYEYDKTLLTKMILSDGRELTFEYTSDYFIEKITDSSDGSFVYYEYADDHLVKVTDQANTSIEYSYDTNHNMTSWKNRSGEVVIENQYDDKHRVTYQIDGLGSEVTLEYLSDYTLTTDGNGNQEKIYFDDSMQTTKIEYADGNQVEKEFEKGLLQSEVLENGLEYQYQYDSENNLIQMVRSDGYTENYRYDSNHNVVEITTSLGESESFSYDGNNNLTSITDRLGNTTNYTYNSQNKKVVEQDSLGNSTRYEYNSAGYLAKITYPDSTSFSYSYNSDGFISSMTDQFGNTTSYTLTARNELEAVVYADGTVERYEYDPNGNVTAFQNRNGFITRTEYNLYGNVVKAVDGNGNTTNYVYDANQNKIEEIYPDGTSTITTYDSRNRIETVTSLGLTTTYQYNEYGIETITNPKGQEQTYRYDTLGNVIEVVGYNGLVTTSSYDEKGLLLEETDVLGNTTNYTYNKQNQVVQVETEEETITYQYDARGLLVETTVTTADSVKVTKNTYNTSGKLIKTIDPEGNETSYEYVGNQIHKLIYPDGSFVQYQYDSNNQIKKETYSNGMSRSYSYDGLGNEISVTDTNGFTTSYVYDRANNLVQVKDGLGYLTNYTVDSMNRVIKEVSPLGATTEYRYDEYGNLVTKIENGIAMEQYQYDAFHRLTAQEIKGVGSTYRYDEYDQLLEVVEATGLVTTYSYDDYYRLVEEKVNDTTFMSYEYDQYSRVVKEIDCYGAIKETIYNSDSNALEIKDYTSLETTFTYNLNNQVVQTIDSLGNTVEYQYDSLGRKVTETVNGAVTSFEYDFFGNINKKEDTLGNTTEYLYDGESNLIKETNALGVVTTYQYDKVNQRIKETTASQTIEWVYNADGQVIKTIDGLGGVTQTSYNLFGNPIAVIDALGYKTSYQYDQNQNRIEVIDSLGVSTKYQYNTYNQLIAKIDGNGNKTSYQYDVFGNISKQTNPKGGTEKYGYNELNQLEQEVTLTGLVREYQYNLNNEIVAVKEDGVITTTNQYDEYGRKVAVIDALGNESKIIYDQESRIIEEVDALGYSQEFFYNTENQVIKFIEKNGLVTQTEYDAVGQIIVIDTQGRVENYEYDVYGNVSSYINANSHTTSYTYDLNNQLIQEELPSGAVTSYTYNLLGTVTSETDASGATTEYIYDSRQQLIQTKNALGYVVTNTYDAVGNLIAVQNERGFTTYYEYDSENNLTKEYNRSTEIYYLYDEKKQLVEIKNEAGQKERYVYDVFSNVTEVIRKDGTSVYYSYDVKNQLIQKNNITYSYDALGQMIWMSDPRGNTEIEYDALGQMILVNRNDQIIEYGYSLYGEQERIVYPDGSIAVYQYDKVGQLVQADVDSNRIQYTYNEDGYLIKEVQSSGLVVEQSYDAIGNLTAIKNTNNGTVINEIRYEYNELGSVVKEEKKQLGVTSTLEHEYNENDELVKTTEIKDGETTVTSYLYSLEGNKIEVTNNSLTSKKEYNVYNQLLKYSDETYSYIVEYDLNGNRIRETRSDGKVKHYKYDEYNQLIEVIDFDLTLIKYSYDGLGNRETQLASRVHTIFSTETVQVEDKMNVLINRLQLLETEEYGNLCLIAFYNEDEVGELPTITTEEEVVTSQYIKKPTVTEVEEETINYHTEVTEITYVNDLTAEFVEVLTEKQNGVTTNHYYAVGRVSSNQKKYIYDGYSNVVVLLSASNTVQEEYEYSAYGERNIEYNPFLMNNAYGYQGEAHTKDNLQYLRARYYDTEAEVFIQEDTYLGTQTDLTSRNRYTYSRNNPYKYNDPSGFAPRRDTGGNNARGTTSSSSGSGRGNVSLEKKSEVIEEKKSSLGSSSKGTSTTINRDKHVEQANWNNTDQGRVAVTKEERAVAIQTAAEKRFEEKTLSKGSTGTISYVDANGKVVKTSASAAREQAVSKQSTLQSTLSNARAAKKETSADQVARKTVAMMNNQVSRMNTNFPRDIGSLTDRLNKVCDKSNARPKDNGTTNGSPATGGLDTLFSGLSQIIDGLAAYAGKIPISYATDTAIIFKETAKNMSNAFNLGNRYSIVTYESGTNPNLNIHYQLSQNQDKINNLNIYLTVINVGINIGDDLYKDAQAETESMNSYTNFLLNLSEPILTSGAGATIFTVAAIVKLPIIVPVLITIGVGFVISDLINDIQEAIRNVNVEEHMQDTLDFYYDNEEYFKELEELYGYDLEPFKDKTNLLDNVPKNNQPSYNQPFE